MKQLGLVSLVLMACLGLSGCAPWKRFNDYLGSKAIKYEPRSVWQNPASKAPQDYQKPRLAEIIP